MPKENERELKEIPAKVTRSIHIQSIEHMDDVLKAKVTRSIHIQSIEHMDDVLKHALVLEDPDSLFAGPGPPETPCWFTGQKHGPSD